MSYIVYIVLSGSIQASSKSAVKNTKNPLKANPNPRKGQQRQQLLPPQSLQMLQNRQVGIHPPLNTILRTPFLSAFQPARRDLSGDAFLPADIRQMVNGFI